MENHENSSTILQRALSGDENAWDKLFIILWPVICGVVSSKVMNTHLSGQIEDIAQNVLIKLLDDNAKRLRLFSPEKGMLERFVSRVARNHAIDHLRNPSNGINHIDIAKLTDLIVSAEEPLPMLEEWEVNSAMGTLGEREREVIQLHYHDHLDATEIAEKLNITVSTVRSEKSRALKKLRHFFGRSENCIQRSFISERTYK